MMEPAIAHRQERRTQPDQAPTSGGKMKPK
jgi:hypothetical protein